MDEFELINSCFKTLLKPRPDVVLGIGDDAACVRLPPGETLLVSTDTLVSGVHFFPEARPQDIAWRSVAVNVSDIAAMAGTPRWITLALTLPEANTVWVTEFAQGLQVALQEYHVALIGGDTTKGPLSITITVMGTADPDTIIRRSTANVGDSIYVSGDLGAAALAVKKQTGISQEDQQQLMHRLMHPRARTDLSPVLRSYASAAIDVSDGLVADLGHICEQSNVGATLFAEVIPVHPLLSYYLQQDALRLALTGGDDYELCFTIPGAHDAAFQAEVQALGLTCTRIGCITSQPGVRVLDSDDRPIAIESGGYTHF